MRNPVLLLMGFMHLFGCSNGNYVKPITIDTLDILITDELHVKSLFYNGQRRIQYFERNGEFDGQRVEYDSLGKITRISYYTMGYIMAYESFYYSNNQLDSSTITNFPQGGAQVCCRATYKSNEIVVDSNSQYFEIKPKLGNLRNDSVVTIIKHGEQNSLFVAADYKDGVLISFGDTTALLDSVSYLFERSAPWFYPIRGEILFLSPLTETKHLIDARIPICIYFYKLQD